MQDPQIIPPKSPHPKDRKNIAILVAGIIALIAAIVLLIDFAIGIILLVLGFAGISWYTNHKDK